MGSPYQGWGSVPRGKGKFQSKVLGECVISSVLPHRSKDLTWWTSVTAQFYRQAKDSLPSKCEGRLTPKGESLNLSWLYLFIHLVSSLLSLPFANWASQEGDVFVSPEFLTLVHGFSFVPFSQDFPFPCLLATAILDFFFLF